MKRITLTLAMFFLLAQSAVVSGAVLIDEGKKVKFDYTLYVQGQVADSSEGKIPIQYTHGEGVIVKGLERQLVGLKVGDQKTIIVSPEEGYGPLDPNGVVEFPKEDMVEDIEPMVGMMLQVQTQSGKTLNGMIVEIKDETMTLNFNHPLAGKELTFMVKIVNIE